MAVTYTILPEGFVDDSIGAQVLYQWTRSEIVRADLVVPGEPERVLSFIKPTLIDGSHVVFRWPPGTGSLFGGTPVIRTVYRGEPTRDLLVSYISDEKDRYNAGDLRADWMACREKGAKTRGQKFFLDLDQQTHRQFLYLVLDPAAKKLRGEQLDLVFGYLSRKIRVLAGVATFPYPIPWPSKMKDIADLIEGRVREHYVADFVGAMKDFEGFAAGVHRQECPLGPGLPSVVAADADSAYVFFFAQFALEIIDHASQGNGDEWDARAEFWRQFLKVFVQMQTIYLRRWKANDPKCFREYLSEVPKLPPAEIEEVRRQYASFGNHPDDMRVRMIENLQSVIQGKQGRRCLSFS